MRAKQQNIGHNNIIVISGLRNKIYEKNQFLIYSRTLPVYSKGLVLASLLTYICIDGDGPVPVGFVLERLNTQYQEAKYVERWPSTTSAWAGWSRYYSG
jgi:hypothetical protein